MSSEPQPRRLELLVLARLHTKRKKPPGKREARAAVEQLLGRSLPAPHLKEALEQTLERLARAGEVTRSPLRITDTGRKRVRDELGLEQPQQWRHIKNAVLPALALGFDPTDRRRVRKLGRIDELRKLVTARAAHARGTDAHAVRTAFAQQWLLSPQDADPSSQQSSPPAKETPAPARQHPGPPVSIEDFGHAVKRHAAETSGGRHGSRKVFIDSVWAHARHDPQCADLDFEGFKQKLIDAHRAGLLTLHRADLVGAMDRQKVAASETRYLNATFHFIEVDSTTEG